MSNGGGDDVSLPSRYPTIPLAYLSIFSNTMVVFVVPVDHPPDESPVSQRVLTYFFLNKFLKHDLHHQRSATFHLKSDRTGLKSCGDEVALWISASDFNKRGGCDGLVLWQR